MYLDYVLVSQKYNQQQKTMLINQSTTYQSEVMNLMSFVKTEETFIQMKRVMAEFFAKEADKELNRLWENGTIDDSRIEDFRNIHERTSYV